MGIKHVAAATSVAAAVAGSPPASATQVPGAWYMGDWRCTLDGRATRIVFDVVGVEHRGHEGHSGTGVSGAERRGRLWDRGTWANLSLERATSTTVHFKHADGNNWFLRRISATQARGNSIWNGRPYPLACTKGR